VDTGCGYCSPAVWLKPEPGEPTMLLLPYVNMFPPFTIEVAPDAFWSSSDVAMSAPALMPLT
jgi:hypothetical protein